MAEPLYGTPENRPVMTHTRDPTYFFEDIEVGDEITLGTVTYTTEDIMEFARKYDPQWFHLDEEAAKDSVFGGLVASGLQTICLCNRLAVEEFYSDSALVGGNRLEVDFPRPVWPGDEITFAVEVIDREAREQYPDHGRVNLRMTGKNQDGDLVIEIINHTIFKRRSR